MAKTKGGKREALARDGVLNPHPEAVRDALFVDNPFFDPADLVQVRYEMVRRHEVDGQAIGKVAAKFGVSRPTFYKAQRALAATGLTGLLPRQRGPKGGHKLSDEILAFDVDLQTRSPGMTMAERLAAIEHRFGIKVHRRSLERAVTRKKNNDARRPSIGATQLAATYEALRAAVSSGRSSGQGGLAILIHRGLAAWIAESQEPPAASVPMRSAAAAAAPSAPGELTRVLAGIIVALTTENVHAHS
jgi:transposase